MEAGIKKPRGRESIPASAGIGLRYAHHPAFLSSSPPVSWLEVHSENYFCAGGAVHATLESIRERFPLSLHGVGLSLGSTDPLDRRHLEALRAVIRRYEPGLVSEHLSWGSISGLHLNDLLPLPYTAEALEHVADRIHETQAFLGTRMLIENVSSYFEFRESEIPEHVFFSELVRRTGCGLLVDINNLYVNERNQGRSALDFLNGIPVESVGEIHLAGHTTQTYDNHEILVDTHNALVSQEVWTLYEAAVERFGRLPTLIEWDSELPTLDVLIGEAEQAERIMDALDAVAA